MCCVSDPSRATSGVAVVSQDQLRREILRVRDQPSNPAVGYIDRSARYALDEGMHVIIEGTLLADIYGEMLQRLVADHRGHTCCYRYELSFEETLHRHRTKSVAGEFGEADMRTWWRETDPIRGIGEAIIGADLDLTTTVDRVLADCGW